MDRVVEGFRISFLEVSATTTSDEQRITSEGYALLVTHECHTTCEQQMLSVLWV